MEALADVVKRAITRPDSPKTRVPRKWQRVLSAFLTGRSFNRFQAERELADHCLHSTVSEIQDRGVRIGRRMETVPGFQGLPTSVCRYWIEPNEENLAKARELVGGRDEPQA